MANLRGFTFWQLNLPTSDTARSQRGWLPFLVTQIRTGLVKSPDSARSRPRLSFLTHRAPSDYLMTWGRNRIDLGIHKD